jgi:transcriptional regulator with XRE-family HTH domain
MIEGELGTFLRSRREAVRPEDVGLPSGTRRRTPGLRRAELATLAGVSVDYLIRLEQGRDTHPSQQVLAALAAALRLDEPALARLRQLAVVSQGTELCPGTHPAARDVRPTVRALLERMEPAPALVVNHLTDVLAWTAGYDRLARPLGMLDGEPPNLVRHAFGDDRARAAYPDWDLLADDLVADLHAEVRAPDDDTRALAATLADEVGPAFTERWDHPTLTARRTGVRAVDHPEVGVLRLAYEVLSLPDADRQRLIAYLPADEATATGLDRLAGRSPGRLRAVGDT